MPARERPFKRGGAAHGATPEQRAAMLDLAVAGNPRLAVERIELGLPAPSYTARTLRALAEREPGNRFTLLLGADAAQELEAWYDVSATIVRERVRQGRSIRYLVPDAVRDYITAHGLYRA